MNRYRCIIADDNELDRLTITGYLSKFPEIEIVHVCKSGGEVLEALKEHKVDILFLDIDMEDMSGLELRRQTKQVPICIFATDHPEFALESFELETLDYLLKPYSFERFSQCVLRIKDYMSIRTKATQYELDEEKSVFYIKDGYKKIKILLKDVLFLNAFQNYTLIVTATEKHYVLTTLGNLLKEEQFSTFLRVHKSYAINVNFVQAISSKEIILNPNIAIPIGRAYKDALSDLK